MKKKTSEKKHTTTLNLAVATLTLGMTMGIGANSVFALENERVATAPGNRGTVGTLPKVERPGTEFPKVERPETAFPKVERPGTEFPKVERPGAEFPKKEPPIYDTHHGRRSANAPCT